MFKLAIGIVLIMLNYSIEIGDIVIGIIPDFLGYFVLYLGLKELNGESIYFRKTEKYSVAMAIFSGVMYIVSVVGYLTYISYEMSTVTILNSIYAILMIYIILNMIRGIQDMENSNSVFLNGGKLMMCWKIAAATLLGASVVSLLDIGMGYPALLQIISFSLFFISFIFRILFVAAMAKTYYLYKKVDYGKNI